MVKRYDDGDVGASLLAQLGACERVVRFQAELGRRQTMAQAKAVRRGLNAHDAFYRESVAIAAASKRKGQCFVATLTLGTGAETSALRAYRDLVLRRSVVGRWSIASYYRAGPAICTMLRRMPWLQPPVRLALRLVAHAAARRLSKMQLGES